MAKIRYNEMLPHEIVAARQACPVAYLPVGNIEWHGEHLPVGYDALKADMLAVKCAEQSGGLVFPPLYWGEPRESHLVEAHSDVADQRLVADKMGLPAQNFAPGYMGKSYHEADRFYIELLVHILREVQSLGFMVMTIIAGHYPLLHHARAACQWYSLGLPDSPKTRAWACSGYELVKDQIPDAGDHAAKWETSLLMALCPELVDMSRLPDDPRARLIGVGGINPRNSASAEYGKAGVEAIVTAITTRNHALLEELLTTESRGEEA